MDTISLPTFQPTRVNTPPDYQFRPIRSRRDFQAYFSLRYSVWSQLGYIPRERV